MIIYKIMDKNKLKDLLNTLLEKRLQNLRKTKNLKEQINKDKDKEKEKNKILKNQIDDKKSRLLDKISNATPESKINQNIINIKQENNKQKEMKAFSNDSNIKINTSAQKIVQKNNDIINKKNNPINSMINQKITKKEIQTKIKINTKAKIIDQNQNEHQTAYIKKLIEQREIKENNKNEITLKKNDINQNIHISNNKKNENKDKNERKRNRRK